MQPLILPYTCWKKLFNVYGKSSLCPRISGNGQEAQRDRSTVLSGKYRRVCA